jgi:hypothetical protein
MTRRVLGGAAAALILALGAVGFLPQAAQARTPVVALTSPADGALLASTANIAGQANMTNGTVDWVRLTIESTQGYPVPAARTTNGGSSSLSFSWTPPLAYNGTYKVTALAQGTDGIDLNGPEQAAAARTFVLQIPPVAPSSVTAAPNQVKRTVTLSWANNPEPDIVGYGVYRKEGDTFVARKILQADQTTYVDEIGNLPANTYKYQVFAARKNAAGDNLVVSAPTLTSAKVTSSPAPPTTTTAPVSGSGSISGKGGTTTTAPGTKPTTLATHGKTDLSGFAALLPTGGAKLPNVRSTPPPDPGFKGALPFDGKAGETSVEGSRTQSNDDQALGGTLASSNDQEPSSLRFMAAGLLVTVVLMHLLWLRDEVNREPLPAVVVDEPELELEDS